MYQVSQVISALEEFCHENGETIEQREQRLGARYAPIRDALIKAGDPTINRNIKLALEQLQIDMEDFFKYLEKKT